jgi:uncharacterized protein YdeI (YjbR/CyaY-like superfamily)
MPAPKSFRTPEAFRSWLEQHGARRTELIMRLFKTHASRRGIGYRAALDAALCYGWIDGVRKALDEDSFTQRFTPRRARSNWSAVNIKRARELIAEGLMRPQGLRAFEARDATATAPYSFENRDVQLAPEFEARLRADKSMWANWLALPPYQRRLGTFWVMSAKREETRERRFETIYDAVRAGRPIGVLQPKA